MRKLRAVCSQGFAGGKVLQEGPLKGCKEKNQQPVKHSTALQISRVGWESDSSSLGIPICKLFGWSCGGSFKLEVRDVGICLEDQQDSLKKSSIHPPSKLYSYPFGSLRAQWQVQDFLAKFFANPPGCSCFMTNSCFQIFQYIDWHLQNKKNFVMQHYQNRPARSNHIFWGVKELAQLYHGNQGHP